MQQGEEAELTRHARRWADVAWKQGWYAHALEVLDRAVELNPTDFKLYRKRGTFYLLCPDPKVSDQEQGIADLRRACELSNWREDIAKWVIDLLTSNGDTGPAKEIKREFAAHSRR